jgi:hydrogenase expression/formation protein HypE
MQVNANDVSTSGNRPQFAEAVVLLPQRATERDAEIIGDQLHQAAKGMGIAIVGGHTEVTPGLTRPIVAVTVFSLVKSYVSSAGAREGDSILMTKTAGIEGTAILAAEVKDLIGKLPKGVVARAGRMMSQISIMEEAVAAFHTGRIHAMHDCTEGGVLGAAYEMSLASGLGFVLDGRAVPVAPETDAICRHLSLDPLRLIGSGSLLLAVEPEREAEIERVLAPICRVTRIGSFQESGRTVLTGVGTKRSIRDAPEDELWRVLSRSTGSRQRVEGGGVHWSPPRRRLADP